MVTLEKKNYPYLLHSILFYSILKIKVWNIQNILSPI